ncbi:MAG: radical SAM protein [Myxococcales bacterium]|nr:radical SAM protein [Myxococcales bacterium]
MKIRLIYPRFARFRDTHPELETLPELAGLWKYRMPPALGLQILATLMPDDVEWAVTDANVDPIDFDEPLDLVGVSFFTPQASSAYAIADEFRARGVKVLMGGMHPSMIPEDAAAHADSVCVGDVETLWHTILDDARQGRLRPRYGPVEAPAETWVRPTRSIFDRPGVYDWHAALVQVIRGCPRVCPYCNIPEIQGKHLRFRDLDDVVDDIRGLRGREFYITEDTIMFKTRAVERYATELFERLADLDPRIFLTSAFGLNERPQFLDVLARGGTQCIYVTFGFDPISEGVYRGDARFVQRAKDTVAAMQDRGMRFFGAFGVGFDDDDEGTFDRILEFCESAGIITAEFFIATPFPNTPLWHQWRAEDRLLHTDWARYNCAHVVHRPKRMSEDRLMEGFLQLWRDFYAKVPVEDSLSCFTSTHHPHAGGRPTGSA